MVPATHDRDVLEPMVTRRAWVQRLKVIHLDVEDVLVEKDVAGFGSDLGARLKECWLFVGCVFNVDSFRVVENESIDLVAKLSGKAEEGGRSFWRGELFARGAKVWLDDAVCC